MLAIDKKIEKYFESLKDFFISNVSCIKDTTFFCNTVDDILLPSFERYKNKDDKYINELQQTVKFYVDDLMSSHVNKKFNNKLLFVLKWLFNFS